MPYSKYAELREAALGLVGIDAYPPKDWKLRSDLQQDVDAHYQIYLELRKRGIVNV